MDLGYMLNWDPSKRKNSTQPQRKMVTKSTSSPLPKIDEGKSHGKNMKYDATTQSEKSSDSIMTSDLERDFTGPESTKATETSSVSPVVAALVENSNAEFLPLVSNQNILSVRGVPYAKLGVIGKGASGKVYRVLSRDCRVLALKKIKITNIDRKAMEGYKNEINLLKRLRGNPSIIQLVDSEIDPTRKQVFVVMELGEVDLNHVLQQQKLAMNKEGSNTPRVSLNLNFIRLTWQQMLKAVHSIHEERIIHGDLKPANFLFVRGALKLIDFGIAKAIQSDDTTNIYRESHIGTPNYMSPEALDAGGGDGPRIKIGRASDIWSLGCILYQMVFGRTPFAQLHMFQKLQAIVNPNYQIDFPSDADEAAVDTIKLCLRRKPEDRPPIVGANGLLNEHRFLNG
eukprot:CAMPEP_0118678962 /NCGR_PEP_ID=MMETSP0800-20121206/3516_1 /TAXON_ID=210618 ORGANISM="Striatella unipunctata, Strain CCMP2910" /NCGR_SAMPLE_ID=MMETSP0800 /ASSEMBLY_ACC=CAM_ASM_000638 /LENGTH=398 /DNA_ID=CAMNT_0006574889 /DNA_START=39 /DNA_END=1235 /DNA_ORIENTATION=+